MSEPTSVRVWRRDDHGPYPGVRIGNAVAYEFMVDPQWTRTGKPELQRSFLLLDEGIDMCHPVGFVIEHAQWWYIDVVRFEIDGTDIKRYDMYIDFVVGPTADEPFAVLDLEEFGDAMRAGAITIDHAVAAMHDAQRFLNRRLNRHWPLRDDHDWPDFPPRELEPLLAAPIPPLASI